LAWILNDLGVLLAGKSRLTEAETAFSRSASLAAKHEIPELTTKLYLNRALMYLSAASLRLESDQRIAGERDASKDYDYDELLKKAWIELNSASDSAEILDPSFIKAVLFVTIGDSYRSLRDAGPGFHGNFTERAFHHFHAALNLANEIQNPIAISFALGYSGKLYEDQHRYAEALDLTIRARDLSRAENHRDSLYQWEWQAGRILEAMGNATDALTSYRTAREVLSGIRHDVAIGFGNRTLGKSFREAVGNLYFEMVDLMLQQAEENKSDDELQEIYRGARLVVESFKSAELEDYFQDECVNLALAKREELDAIATDTAVFYIIPLSDRTEILVSIGKQIHRFTSSYSAADLNRLANNFRERLENPKANDDRRYLPFAKNLFDALIRPAEDLLEEKRIETFQWRQSTTEMRFWWSATPSPSVRALNLWSRTGFGGGKAKC
jgi:tetratricopeptide (TPR) repeat protein